MDFLAGQSKALRRLFTPEHIPGTRAASTNTTDDIRCSVSEPDTNPDDISVRISVKNTLLKGVKVEVGVHGSNFLEPGESLLVDVRVTNSVAYQ